MQQKADRLMTSGSGGGSCVNAQSQAVAVCKAMVDGRSHTAPSDIHILEELPSSREAYGEEHTRPRVIQCDLSICSSSQIPNSRVPGV